MTPDDFIRKWDGVTLREKQASQEHFLDLCALVGVDSPAKADPQGDWFCFEKGASKAGGGEGWADVWRRGCFAWEYKSPGKDLDAAFRQLQLYTPALEYPPLLIVSDIDLIRIHTAFTGLVPARHDLQVADLRDPAQLNLLKWAFLHPERLRPTATRAQLTEQAAAQLGALAQTWRGRGHDPLRVAHFCQQVLFCLFAEDIDLLPDKLFTQLLEAAKGHPGLAQRQFETLFGAMATGGLVGFKQVDWFNGGLFTANEALPVELADIRQLLALAALDWSAIDPTIAGTLFVRSLDPALRAQLGAEYTDPATIMRLVNPVVLDPLRTEWAAVKGEIQAHLDKAQAARSPAAATKARNAAMELYQGFLHRLQQFRVLDPACGSGNFLLLSLLGLKDLEHQVITEAEAMGLPRQFPIVGPENVLGIEINPFAAELARVSLWIGEIQWMLNHGFALAKSPILRNLDNIQLRDAILNPDGTEPEWPEADVIVGNPPFLGDKKMLGALGAEYVTRLRSQYQGRVPGGADLVTYWFEKARAQINAGKVRLAGLVATNSIRGGANRRVLERIVETGSIFEAWSDEPWINDGAAVRVSLVAFGPHTFSSSLEGKGNQAVLNGETAAVIHADLTPGSAKSVDLTKATRLSANAGVSFIGTQQNGPFTVSPEMARKWLVLPNPHGAPNSEVVKPWRNGLDITRRSSDTWIVDFGTERQEAEAALYEEPFNYVLTTVKPMRDRVNRETRRRNWWRLGEAMPKLRLAIRQSGVRYIATPRIAKHRVFTWLPAYVLPDCQVVVIARSDDTTFGILHSRLHELWALRLCTWLGVGNDPRYTPTTTFETFPFPEGLTPADTAGPVETLADGVVLPTVAQELRPVTLAIAKAAQRLNEHRENWLNPPDWVERMPEVVPGYPDRIIPMPGHEKDLKARTLTNLYNQRPHWLDQAHLTLDAAVAAAYGWEDYSPDMPDEVILARLLTINLERSQGMQPNG
jgi:type II restriction/modification system DNA methylase subunit YeeA